MPSQSIPFNPNDKYGSAWFPGGATPPVPVMPETPEESE